MWTPEIRETDEPTYLAVANAFADAIERGDLPAGTRLPPQRDLARQLGVTVGTVSRAYSLMKRRRLVNGEVGRGTFVCGNRPSLSSLDFSGVRSVNRVIDLGCYRSPVSNLNGVLADAVSEASRRAKLHPVHKYPPAAGMLSHRGEGARWLGQFGLDVPAEQVIVCGGAQMAINVALGAFVGRDEAVMTETMTYSGLRALCGLHNIELVGLEMDGNGLVPEALEAACAAQAGRVLFVQPSLHNPTAVTMPLHRRQQIAQLAIDHDLLVIEDDSAAGTVFDRPPPIATLAPERTIYITSVSKSICPALRLGYIAAPRPLVDRLERVLHSLALGVSPLVPDIMSVLLSSGAAEEIVRSNFAETSRRHAVAADVLQGIEYRYHPGAFFLWLPLPERWRANEFAAAVMRQGVNVVEGENFKADRDHPLEAVRISIDGPPGQETLRHGLEVLSRLLRHQPDPWTPVI